MGIGYDEFWTLTPRKLNVMIEGYKLKRKIDDEKDWMLGGYVFEAVSLAVGNAFRKKNEKSLEYFKVRERPYTDSMEEERELTEEEKQKYIDAFMSSLQTMQTNFNSKHKSKAR